MAKTHMHRPTPKFPSPPPACLPRAVGVVCENVVRATCRRLGASGTKDEIGLPQQLAALLFIKAGSTGLMIPMGSGEAVREKGNWAGRFLGWPAGSIIVGFT